MNLAPSFMTHGQMYRDRVYLAAWPDQANMASFIKVDHRDYWSIWQWDPLLAMTSCRMRGNSVPFDLAGFDQGGGCSARSGWAAGTRSTPELWRGERVGHIE